jgi:hypothetical protein
MPATYILGTLPTGGEKVWSADEQGSDSRSLALPSAAMHPLVDITAKEAPVLSYFRRWQSTYSGKLIDG